jgi:hypothetical protein
LGSVSIPLEGSCPWEKWVLKEKLKKKEKKV